MLQGLRSDFVKGDTIRCLCFRHVGPGFMVQGFCAPRFRVYGLRFRLKGACEGKVAPHLKLTRGFEDFQLSLPYHGGYGV